jgi:hypothetical protein
MPDDVDMNPTAAPPPKLNLRKLEKLERLVRFGAILLLAIFIAAIAFSWLQLRSIDAEIASKQVQLSTTQARLKDLNTKVEDKDKELQRKASEIKALETRGSVLAAAMNELGKGPEGATRVKAAVEGVVGLGSDASAIPPRIYFQIADERQRSRARDVQQRLQARGYIVPGIENVGSKARIPAVSQLRFYATTEAALEEQTSRDVTDIVKILRDIGVTLDRPTQLKPSTGVRPRHYEIWFAKDF